MKDNGFELKKEISRRYPAQTYSHASLMIISLMYLEKENNLLMKRKFHSGEQSW